MVGLFDGTSLERPVTCERCGEGLSECACPRDASGAVLAPADQEVRVRREKRRGKHVTVIVGLDPVASDVSGMAKRFRKSFAAGGTVTKEGAIELHGDHRERVLEKLRAMGYPAKAGGG